MLIGHRGSNPNDTGDGNLRDVLELIVKRLDNLEQRKYFPSPFEDCARFAAGDGADSATLAASKSAALEVPRQHISLLPPLPLLVNQLMPHLGSRC